MNGDVEALYFCRGSKLSLWRSVDSDFLRNVSLLFSKFSFNLIVFKRDSNEEENLIGIHSNRYNHNLFLL